MTTVDVRAAITALPDRTDTLGQGAPPRRAWTSRAKKQQTLHNADGSTVDVPGTEQVLSTVGGGYVTVAGETPTYTLVLPGHPPEELGTSVGFNPVPAASHRSTRDVPVLLSATTGSPAWKVTVVGSNGCRQDLDFTAVTTRLAESVRPVPVAQCNLGQGIGFLDSGEYAALVECGDTQLPKPVRFRLITTSGRILRLAGLEHTYWQGATVLSRSRVLLVPGGRNLGFFELHAYDSRSMRPLWSHRYVVGGQELSLGELVGSPSGRRLLLWGWGRHVVVDARTGRPTAQLRGSPSLKQGVFEDDEHVLLVDDGQVVSTREEPDRAAWIVRCSLGGACELATPVPPRHPRVSIEVVR